MNKVVLVKCFFRPIREEVTVKIPTGEKKKGFFGGEKEVYRREKKWQETGVSDCMVDSSRLASDLEVEIRKLNEDGYVVLSVTPIMSGSYDYDFNSESVSGGGGSFTNGDGYNSDVRGGGSYGYGYGYSFTDSLIVVAEKNN